AVDADASSERFTAAAAGPAGERARAVASRLAAEGAALDPARREAFDAALAEFRRALDDVDRVAADLGSVVLRLRDAAGAAASPVARGLVRLRPPAERARVVARLALTARGDERVAGPRLGVEPAAVARALVAARAAMKGADAAPPADASRAAEAAARLLAV